jgi:hypothetical protein
VVDWHIRDSGGFLEVLKNTNEIKHDMFIGKEILPTTCFSPQKGHLQVRQFENKCEGRQY